MQKGTGLRGHPVTILSSPATFEGMSLSELYMSHKPPIAHTFAISTLLLNVYTENFDSARPIAADDASSEWRI